MKRPSQTGRPSKAARPANEYRGVTSAAYRQIETVSDWSGFKEKYIDRRQPVKLRGPLPVDLERFRLENIEHTLAYDEPLQVERKHGHGFGSGRAREKMPFGEIVAKIQSGDDSYYLTTQYDEDESDAASGDDESDESEDGAFGGEEEFGQEEDDGAEESVEAAAQESAKPSGGEPAQEAGEDLAGESAEDSAEESADDTPLGAAGTDSDDSFDFADLHDDYDDAEAPAGAHSSRVKTLFQPPLTNLAGAATLPVAPQPFDQLVTQQINLWMGTCTRAPATPDLLQPTRAGLGRYVPAGNSSGLHHDHADNLYVLVSGRKRFTLYSPECAPQLHTVGNVSRVYPNGLVDYCVDGSAQSWRPMREDGAIVAEWARWALESGSTAEAPARLEQMVAGEPRHRGPAAPDADPPSFSRVPPVLAHLDEVPDPKAAAKLRAFAEAHYPGFSSLAKLEVWLEPGDMLYIPTGWFHEVTSYATADDAAHIALNWWFVPPTEHGAAAYADDYWRSDFSETLAAVESARPSR